MAETSKIEWTDATWNPITGCSVVSPGCTNCYAMKLAGTRLQHHPSRAGLTQDSKAGPVWTGEVRLNEDWLDQPLRWRRPRRIFVCAHGDLFHERVPDEWIDRVFGIMALASHHTFQVLTKRAERMRKWFFERQEHRAVVEAVATAYVDQPELATRWPFTIDRAEGVGLRGWPLPNVWLGVSVEDQARADERIPRLLATPAAVRFASAEPLLGPVELVGLRQHLDEFGNWRNGAGLNWVIVGGESGPGARPMHPDWARSLRDQCSGAGVPFFFKQFGDWAPYQIEPGGNLGALTRSGEVRVIHPSGRSSEDIFVATGGKVQSERGTTYMRRVGKKAAGAMLDGVLWREMPNG